MEYAKLELNAGKHGWNCSQCGLFFDALGRAIFGHEVWQITSTGTAWIENKPPIKFCPNCGLPIEQGGNQHG